MNEPAACQSCLEPLPSSQWRGREAQSPGQKRFRGEFKSCSCCSREANEHVFYHWSRFGYAPSRETISNAGIENTCSPCRQIHDHAALGPLGGSLHEEVDALDDLLDGVDAMDFELITTPLHDDELARRLQQLEESLAQRPDVYRRALVQALIRGDRPLVRLLKLQAGYACQFDGCTVSIGTRSGTPYVEVAHVTPVASGGSASALNLVVLCPNHHKMLDLGRLRIETDDAEGVAGVLNGAPFRIRRPGFD